MRGRFKKWPRFPTSLVAGLCLAASLAHAQQPCPPPPQPPQYCPPSPAPPYMPGTERVVPPDLTTPPGMMAQPGAMPADGGVAPGTAGTLFAGLGTGAGVGSSAALAPAAVGYIDYAVPRTTVRLRFDASYGNNVPDRAEFFYAKCGCFRVLGADPNAAGPPKLETNVDYQDLWLYLEGALSERFSVFVDLGTRFINPDVNDNSAGLADMNAGFKWAVVSCADQVVTFQMRTYAPTGDPERGLGTNHVSVEPGLLWFQQLSDGLSLSAEFRDWIPIGGTDFQGNVLRYGVGLSYDVYRTGGMTVTPVAEFVGWTVLNGKKLPVPPGIALDARGLASSVIPALEAGGDTIVNAKLGLRVFMGANSSFYAGYGRALTGEVWYKDTMRFEYRWNF